MKLSIWIQINLITSSGYELDNYAGFEEDFWLDTIGAKTDRPSNHKITPLDS